MLHYKLPNVLALLPYELRRQVMLHCGLPNVLELAITLQAPEFIDEIVKTDPVRKRVAMSIQASQLFHNETRETHLMERTVTLSENMKAVFIDLGGEQYLQDIVKDSAYFGAVDITIEEGRAQLLALHDWGIRDIAFASDKQGNLKWARGVTRKADIFMDREAFKRIRIKYDVSTDC
jgi:hypothetical protein